MDDLTAIPAQQQEWPGTEAELDPQPDHGLRSWTPRGRLTGKKALITGGDSGIGRAIAITFAHEGADVAIGFLPEEEDDARRTAEMVAELDRRCVTVPGDLRDEESCTELAEAAEIGRAHV